MCFYFYFFGSCVIIVIIGSELFSEIPLAPQKVLTQFGLQGITARDGIIAFLTQGGYQSQGDYAVAVYVMMSRARQLGDVFIVDLPKREIFEGFLQARNPTLVRRMQELEYVTL